MADGIRFWLRLGLLLATFSLLNTASLHRTARNATDKEISKNEHLSHIVRAKYETDLEHKDEEIKALDEIRTLGSKTVQHENSHKSSGVSSSEESFTPLFDQQTDETKQFRGSTKYFTTLTNLNLSTSTTTESSEQSKTNKLETNINLPPIKNEVRNTIQTQNIHKQNVKYELNDDPGIQNKEPNRKFSRIPHINTKNPIKDVNQEESVKQTNNTTSIELQNSKSNDKSATIAERSETGRSFDIDKYISPEFHNINNVYTQISSAEAERYADPNNYGEIYHSTKPFGKTFSYSVTHDYDAELTTPKSTLFDSKFHQISNDIKYNLDQDENLSETNANRSYNTDKVSVESLLTKKSDNDTNISIDFKNKLNITLDEDNVKKGSKRMNVSVENGTVLHFHSDFLKTEIFTELPKQENETNSSLETSNTILDSINTEKSSSTGKPVDMWTTLKPRIQNRKIEPENSSVESLSNLNDKNELLKKPTLKLKPYVLSTSIPTSIDPLYDNQTVETDKVMKIDKDNRIGINKRGSTKYMNTVTNQPDTVTSESVSKPISISTTVTSKDTEKNSSDSFVQENKIFSVQIAPPNNQIKPTTSQYDRILTSNLATDYFEITTYKPKISTETVSDYPTDLPILTESIDELRNKNSSKTVSIVNNNEINVNVTKNSKPVNDLIDSIFPEYAVKKPTENISTTQRPNSSRQNLNIDDLFENIFKSPLITHTQSSTKPIEYSTEFMLSTDKPVTSTDETTTFEQSELDVTKKIDQKTIRSTDIISDIETTVTSSFKSSENTLTERETTEAYTESVSSENSVPSTSQKTTSNTSQVPSTSEKIENIVSSTIKMAKNLHIPKSTTEMEIESTSYTLKNSGDETTYSHDSSTTLSPEDISYSTSFTQNELSTKPTKVLQDDVKSTTPEIDNVSGGEFTQTTTIEVNTILNNKSLEITTFETNTILDDLLTSTQETSLSNKFSEMTTDSINTSDVSSENNLPQSSTISQKDDTFDRFTSTMKNDEEFTTEMYTSTKKLKVQFEDITTKSTVDVISTTKIESTTPKAENEPQITTLISKIENDNDVDGDGDQLESQSETNDKTNQDYEDFTNEANDNQEEHQTTVTTKINKKDPELFDTNNNKLYKPTNNVDVSAEEMTEESTTGETEENIEEELTVGTVAAIIIASVAVLCLVLLALLLVIMRKRQSRLTYGQRCTPVSLDAYSLDSVSIYNSVRRKGGVRASKRSYGNPAFEDSSTVTNPMNFAAMANFVIDKEAIMKEFEDIPQVSVESNELPEGCESKNRYANVIPLPETKVILSLVEGDIHSDYINANFVRGPKNAKSYYIACQAPMEETIDDFWRMVWERQSRVILMLTELVENGIEKCANYLPPSEITDNNRQFGDYQITLKKREVRDKYIISCLLLKNMVSNCWREITHLWYIGWPERGVPEEANSIIAFLIEARSYLKVNLNSYQPNQNGQKLSENGYISDDVSGQGPVVVHCSPGTGRTGTIIACDIAIREFELLRLVDIPKTVYRIRRDRAGAVQTRDQYSFIYKVINLYATKLTGGAMESI